MTDSVKTCANCGHSQVSGDYCEACGTRLPMEGPSPVAAGVPGTAAAASAGPIPSQAAPPQPASRPPGTPPPGMGQVAPPMYSPPSRRDGFWARFFDLSFEHFITPSLIKVLFIIAMVVIGLGVLSAIIMGFVASGAFGIFVLIAALIAGFIYLLLARVFLEMVVVFFRIRDDTEEMARRKR
jgi:hypothetical protein